MTAVAKEKIQEQLRKDGMGKMPPNSEFVSWFEMWGHGKHDGRHGDLRINFDSTDKPVEDEEITFYIGDEWHNCTCHKLVALCFFEWNGKEYKQVPLIEGCPNSQHIVLGSAMELDLTD